MDTTEIKALVESQRSYFETGATLPYKKRIETLNKLYDGINRYRDELSDALKSDLGKSSTESFMCEIGLVLSEITYMRKHLRGFMREKHVKTPITNFAARSYTVSSPYGVTLIMSPWNYPVLLSLTPLADALAAGNTVILKPSAYSEKTSAVMAKMLNDEFPKEIVAVVTGGRAENTSLLDQHFDYMFFTGSKAVGGEVLRSASEYLTPVTLELGGKSPCIIEKSANIKLSATRVVWGKFLNCGQTCVAPDYILCDESVKEEFVSELKKQIEKQFGKDPLDNPDYGKMINEKHFKRVLNLMDASKIVAGGESDAETLRIAPTVMDNVTWDDAVMQEEIFGPVLPIVTFKDIEEVVKVLNGMDSPLAFYIFTGNKKIAKDVIARTGFGGGCINDTVVHLATTEMGFGGFGSSGMGAYHGKTGFETFSHKKSIMDKKTWIDVPMRYQPFKKYKDMMLHAFLK